jgi:hypothetical protein
VHFGWPAGGARVLYEVGFPGALDSRLARQGRYAVCSPPRRRHPGPDGRSEFNLIVVSGVAGQPQGARLHVQRDAQRDQVTDIDPAFAAADAGQADDGVPDRLQAFRQLSPREVLAGASVLLAG